MESLLEIISLNLNEGNTITITAPSIIVNYTKQIVENLESRMTMTEGWMHMAEKFCQMYQESAGQLNCTNKTVITSQSTSRYMAIAGMNGDGDTNMKDSGQIGLTFNLKDNQKVKIRNLQTPITFTVTKDSSITSTNDLTFKQINTTSNVSYTSNQMRTYLFPLSGTDVALMLQLKPSNFALRIPYLMFLQFGSAPVYNSTSSSFQYARLFCYGGELIFLFLNKISNIQFPTSFIHSLLFLASFRAHDGQERPVLSALLEHGPSERLQRTSRNRHQASYSSREDCLLPK